MNISYQFHMKHPNIIIEIWFLERMPWTHASIFIKSHTAASGVLADYHKSWEIKIILVTHYRLTNLSSNSTSSIFLHPLILAWGTWILFLDKSWERMKQPFAQPTITPKPFDSNLLQGGPWNVSAQVGSWTHWSAPAWSTHSTECGSLLYKPCHHFRDSGLPESLPWCNHRGAIPDPPTCP